MSENLKNHLDEVISYLSALDDNGTISWSLARDFNSNDYQLLLSKNRTLISPESIGVYGVLNNFGYTENTLKHLFTNYVTEQVVLNNWTSYREKTLQKMRGQWFRPSNVLFKKNQYLNNLYWNNLLKNKRQGLESDSFKKNILTQISSPFSLKRKNEILKLSQIRINELKQLELNADISLLVLAAKSCKWQQTLKKIGFNASKTHNGVPAYMYSIEDDASNVFFKESIGFIKYKLQSVPNIKEIPSSWIKSQNNFSEVPLWVWIIQKSSFEKIKILINEHPEFLKYQDSRGNSPLHWAAILGRDDVVDFFLKNGANPDIENKAGLLAEEVVPIDKNEIFEKISDKRLKI